MKAAPRKQIGTLRTHDNRDGESWGKIDTIDAKVFHCFPGIDHESIMNCYGLIMD